MSDGPKPTPTKLKVADIVKLRGKSYVIREIHEQKWTTFATQDSEEFELMKRQGENFEHQDLQVEEFREGDIIRTEETHVGFQAEDGSSYTIYLKYHVFKEEYGGDKWYAKRFPRRTVESVPASSIDVDNSGGNRPAVPVVSAEEAASRQLAFLEGLKKKR